MLSKAIFAFLLFGIHYGESGTVPTSTQNCYYTFVVPRDQDGGNSGTSAEIQQLRSEITDLRTTLTSLLQKVNGLSQQGSQSFGVNFVNWGRKDCPVNTTTVYTGYAAKTRHTTVGGGVNYQCLPADPDLTGKEVAGLQSNTDIHGVEYYATLLPDILPHEKRHNNVPCTVCDVDDVSQTLMIPAKVTCPSGWSILYEGNLMAERTHPAHKSASTYICVNKDLEFVDGGQRAEDSGYIMPVEVVCGIIPCPPYSAGYEVPCVVCAK